MRRGAYSQATHELNPWCVVGSSSGRVAQSAAEAFDAKARAHGQTRAERIRELVNAVLRSALRGAE